MSSPLAIGAVTAVLRNLLDNGMVEVGSPMGASVNVTAVAPDLVTTDDPDAPPSLNLFLYRVTPNQGWRNAELPSYSGNGRRLTNPPLALDLHYLLTAYGNADFQAEILLGYAAFLLHERPVLDRDAIRTALDPDPLGAAILPPTFHALSASDLADQIESVTVTMSAMDTEELARLWSATQAPYRPTVGYTVSVVLIEIARQTRAGLPVLSRGAVDPTSGRDRGVVVEPSLLVPLPTITRVQPPDAQPAARLGETIRIEGHHLDGTGGVVHFVHPTRGTPIDIAVGAIGDSTGFDVALPSADPADSEWRAGLWSVSLDVVRPGEVDARSSNVAPLLLAPDPETSAATITRDGGTGAVRVEIEVHPHVQPGQPARLALGSDVAIAEPVAAETDTLAFDFGVLPPGPRWLRLSVDGVESILIDRTPEVPSFHPSESVTVP